jgi:GT2 family glycosyltransferase
VKKGDGRQLSIVILNWNGIDDTRNCLDTLKQSTFNDFRTLVVDNGSTSREGEQLKRLYPEIDLIELDHNHGYGGGNNIGIAEALNDAACEYILLLNNDTLVPPETLGSLVSKARQNPKTLLSPVILEEDGKTVQSLGGRIWRYFGGTTNIGRGQDREEIRSDLTPDFLSGCALLGPRSFFETVGGFATEYFAYYEDAELGLVARRTGYGMRVCHDVTVLHLSSVSTRGNEGFKTYLLMRNTILFGRRNMSIPNRIVFGASGVFLRLVVEFSRNPSPGVIAHWFRGVLDGSFGDPRHLRLPDRK